jgi:diguanylate cyclase (GGDEF)-like protein/PAS domain S-box-containing protein
MTADLRVSQAKLIEEQRRTQQLIEVLPNPVYFKATDGRYLGVNKAWETFFSMPRQAFLGKTVHDLYPGNPALAQRLHDDDQALWDHPGTKSIETTITTADGELRDTIFYKATYTDPDGGIAGLIGTIVDITERKRMEAEILALSNTDQLTGLHNRRGFLSLAEQQLKLSERNKRGMQLYFADLDELKWINDTLGHEEGDKALIEAATVFKETFRTSDIIARLGGDEYAALAVDITEANSEIFTARLQSLIEKRNNQENRRYRLSISVGCSYYDPENPCSLDELMASADKLMYEQKQNKKGLLL